MKKRIYSKFLIFCMIFSLMPVSVRADALTNKQTSDISRYTVLVLDDSGSMYGKPLDTLKAAAKTFCDQVLKADGQNYVSVVSYSSEAYTECGFSQNITEIKNSIDNLYSFGGTNTTDGLKHADNLLSAIPAGSNIKKNVLLLSDGLPTIGMCSYSGHYKKSDYSEYGYANSAYDAATTLKNKGDSLYTLGFFHSVSGGELTFARKFMSDLQNAGYYDVVNADNLKFTFGDIANKIIKKGGKFRYASGDDRDYEATYFYDDAYFYNSSYTYNENLATMSLCLAMSAFGSNEKKYSCKSDNVKDLLEQIGFSKFDTNYWDTVKPTTDSIGVVAANKQINVDNKPYTLIAVAIRGAGYEQEWASNLTVGESGMHQGFNQAKNSVLSFIKQYIDQNRISGDIKLWITGYSRAAATTNLVAGAIDDGETFGNCSLDFKNLYAYDFETPMGTIAADAQKRSIYKNIFNIVNPSDPVPKVAPSEFNFTRYGTDKILPAPELDDNYLAKQPKMLNKYDALDSTVEPYAVDNFIMKKLSLKISHSANDDTYVEPVIVSDTKNHTTQSGFLDTFITKLSKEQFKSRSNYVSKYQDGMREIFKVINGTTNNVDGKQDVKWARFKGIFRDKLTTNTSELIASTICSSALTVGLIEKYAVESLNQAGITSYNKDEISKLALTLTKTILSFAISHPNLTATLTHNLKEIGSAHYPELCLAWLESMDKNYTTNAEQAFGSGSYRIIRINCPVDVEVYDASNKLVAAIKSDNPQKIDGSSIVSSINEDDEKLIYLPANAEYNLKLIPTGLGHMTYSINEYSSAVGDINRIINYYDVDIKPGEILTSKIAAYSNEDLTNEKVDGSRTKYSLVSEKNQLLKSNYDLRGHEATNAYYMVNVTSNNAQYGLVAGQGTRQIGNYAKVTAVPCQNCKFDGWYIGDKKVSSQAEYRFRVESDVNIVGKFTGDNDGVTISVNKTTDCLSVGETDILKANVTPSNVNNNNIIWTSSNKAVATVDPSGKVTAISPGNSVITASILDGKKIATCNVTVTNPTIPVTSVSLNKTTNTLNVGSMDTLIATINPTSASTKDVSWTSNNTSVATVDSSGKITAVGLGHAVITVMTVEGRKTATCNVTVVRADFGMLPSTGSIINTVTSILIGLFMILVGMVITTYKKRES